MCPNQLEELALLEVEPTIGIAVESDFEAHSPPLLTENSSGFRNKRHPGAELLLRSKPLQTLSPESGPNNSSFRAASPRHLSGHLQSRSACVLYLKAHNGSELEITARRTQVEVAVLKKEKSQKAEKLAADKQQKALRRTVKQKQREQAEAEKPALKAARVAAQKEAQARKKQLTAVDAISLGAIKGAGWNAATVGSSQHVSSAPKPHVLSSSTSGSGENDPKNATEGDLSELLRSILAGFLDKRPIPSKSSFRAICWYYRNLKYAFL